MISLLESTDCSVGNGYLWRESLGGLWNELLPRNTSAFALGVLFIPSLVFVPFHLKRGIYIMILFSKSIARAWLVGCQGLSFLPFWGFSFFFS